MRFPQGRMAIGVVFLAISLGFGAVYWIIWLIHPDYYVVASEANLRPIDALWAFLLEGDAEVT
jgi:hypothetical protein